jgi:hypothetical protein
MTHEMVGKFDVSTREPFYSMGKRHVVAISTGDGPEDADIELTVVEALDLARAITRAVLSITGGKKKR